MIRKLALYSSLVALLFAKPVAASQPGVTRYDTNVNNAPAFDARTIGKLRKQTRLNVLQRKGGWYLIEGSPKTKGWVRLTAIKLGDGTKQSSGKGNNGLQATINLIQTGRSGSHTVSASTGVRGLDTEDIKKARPKKAAVRKLDKMACSDKDARSFSQQLDLMQRKVAYFPKTGKRN